jgi:rod shape determining protein RodA
MVLKATIRAALGAVAMCALAQVKPAFLRRLALPLWCVGVMLLIIVDITGHIGKGAQRWLDIGFRFQPSEIMKLAVPMACAWWLHDRPLPPDWKSLFVVALLILTPSVLTIVQPDLGTGGLIMIAGTLVVIMAGLQFRVMFGLAAAGAAAAWFAWQYVLYDYQKQRVFTLLDPESDKLGAGYHIIQSQIAIGSGGVFGKGLTNGSQGQLEFLPERTTDFIYAMVGEELGLLGATILLLLYCFIVGRALYLAVETQDTFARLLAGSIALTFFVYVFINAGMVSGLLPVVGVPLPLVSYGGTSMVTLLASFGILMSLYSHRKLVAS